MLIPIDDHMVHRGDGVFEAFKCVDGAIYNLEGHLRRLHRSAAAIALAPPVDQHALTEIIRATIRAGAARDCHIRLYVSRGPGGFSPDPAECRRPGLYVVVTAPTTPFMLLHPEGARGATSSIPAKAPFYAGVKSCNYLPNVLMKKEERDLGVDFVLAFDENGHAAEGATENIGVVTREHELLFPRTDGTLEGTTMLRVVDLAGRLVKDGVLRAVRYADIPRPALAEVAEMLVVGTSWNVAAVREFDGRPVGDGEPGPVWHELDALLDADIRRNPDLRTPVF
jgi:branched-chain amino acid aminotransferase